MLPEPRRMAPCPHWLAATILALSPLISAPGASQPADDDAQPWYRVEILIFRQPGDAGLAAEAWEPEPRLDYPEPHRHLVDRALADARLQAFPGSRSDVDRLGGQRLRLPAPRRAEATMLDSPTDSLPLGEDIPAAPPSGTAGEPGPAAALPQADDPALSGPPPLDPLRGDARLDAENPDVPLPTPAPFTLLPESFRELAGDAARMRSAGYEILMHRTWVQPVAEERAARAVILDRSGDPDVTAWPRLQGSLTLHLSRYLHVNTRLWLNTDGDYLHPEWRMPEPPRAPTSLELALPALDDWRPIATQLAPGLEVTRPDGRVSGVQSPRDTALPGTDAAQGQHEEDRGYPWRHAIALEQSRRMRGGELHYLDHPVFGVLIKLTLMEDKDLRDMYLGTLDWAWEDRHNVVVTDRESVRLPPQTPPLPERQ